MKPANKTAEKLSFKKESIRVLSQKQLRGAAGGGTSILVDASATDGCGTTQLTNLLTYPCCHG